MTDNILEEGKTNGNTKVQWKNRRRMAWTSLISMIIITGLVLFTPLCSESKLKVLSDVITWYYFCCSSVIGIYMGATTWASIKGK